MCVCVCYIHTHTQMSFCLFFSLFRNQLSLSTTCAKSTDMERLVLLHFATDSRRENWLPKMFLFVLKKVTCPSNAFKLIQQQPFDERRPVSML